MTFVRGDAAAAAKALRDFRRGTQNTLLEFKGGWMNGAPLTPADVDAIAQLPSRDVLYGRLVGMVASPLTGLAAAMGGLISGLARQLQAMADQGLVGQGASAPAAETTPPADETPDPDAEPPATDDETPGPHPDPQPNVAEGDQDREAS